jgi:hypothetical protein
VRLFRAKYQWKVSCPKQDLHFIAGQRFALIYLGNNVWYLFPWHVAAFQQLQANKHDTALLVTSSLRGAGRDIGYRRQITQILQSYLSIGGLDGTIGPPACHSNDKIDFTDKEFGKLPCGDATSRALEHLPIVPRPSYRVVGVNRK